MAPRTGAAEGWDGSCSKSLPEYDRQIPRYEGLQGSPDLHLSMPALWRAGFWRPCKVSVPGSWSATRKEAY